MDPIKELCQEMARDPDIMTFSDIAKAAISGVAENPDDPLSGAVLGVATEASKRVVRLGKRLVNRPKG